MVRILPFLFLVHVGLAAIALISCISAEDRDLRELGKISWSLLIVLFPLVGPIGYFYAGRPISTPPARPLAPDDDPDFLRSLGKQEDAPE